MVETKASNLIVHHCFHYLLKIRLWVLGWGQQTFRFNIILGSSLALH